MIKQIHSYWAYLVLFLLILTVLNALVAWIKKRPFKKSDYKIGLFAMIATHIQLLIGLFVFFFSEKFTTLKEIGMAATMKNEAFRKVVVEHPVAMLLAVILVTIGWSRHKKKTESTGKFKSFFIFYTLALALVIYMIPADFWKTFFICNAQQ